VSAAAGAVHRWPLVRFSACPRLLTRVYGLLIGLPRLSMIARLKAVNQARRFTKRQCPEGTVNEISDSMIHVLDTALLAYLKRQNAIEVRDLPGFNAATVREAAWRMFADGWIGMAGDKRAGFKRAINRTERRANRHRHRPIVERYLFVVRSIMSPRPNNPARLKGHQRSVKA
jgi:hypothetical protein